MLHCISLTRAWLARSALAASIVLLIASPGCVRRRLVVRSNPPGAMVYVDNQPIGTTPCATSFVYYGTREIRLVKAGYETLTVKQPIPAPWYEIPPLDFAAENLTPNEIQDYRTVTYNLSQQVVVPTDQFLARAQQLRTGTQQGAVLPTGVQTAPDAATLNPPMMINPPTMSAPGMAPGGPGLTAPVVGPEGLGPGILVPSTPGAGVLPPGGRPLEPLPAPQ